MALASRRRSCGAWRPDETTCAYYADSEKVAFHNHPVTCYHGSGDASRLSSVRCGATSTSQAAKRSELSPSLLHRLTSVHLPAKPVRISVSPGLGTTASRVLPRVVVVIAPN